MKLLRRPKPAAMPLELSEVVLQPYDSQSITYNRFTCGKTPLDRFIKSKANKESKRLEQKVFVAIMSGSRNCIGYFALQLGSDTVPNLPKNELKHLQNRVAFPAVHLSYLGVDLSCQGQGLGRLLLMEAFEKTAKISDIAGFHALTLQSIDAESTAFYKRIGFTEYSEGGTQPKMLYPIHNIRKVTGRD
ncbi:MAG: GNAT family N-acetyltransferase [Tateyamaria sp.]|uniref:GNAT family N-acetyltransferase n=1 Tax=Tateyamaria sp. TaxID=1929288 RepID=UPI00329C404F